ncbi:unnamed protein product [Jaminaea pallidilutea]
MSYTIAGKKILNEHLALGILGSLGVGGWYATRDGGDKKAGATAGPKTNSPPIVASNSEEENFIKQFLAEAEGDKSGQKMV